MTEAELLAGAPLVALFVGASTTAWIRRHRRGTRTVDQGGYQQWLEQNRGGMNLRCDDCGRADGTHAPGCPCRLIR